MSVQLNPQQVFVDRLNAALPPGQSLAPVLSDLLEVSMDSAYRRINGKTAFSLAESLKVANEFRISLDGLRDPSQQNAHVSFQDLQPSLDSFEEYLDGLIQNLSQLKASPDTLLYYSCLDIPIFLNLSSPVTAAFKMYYWMHSILEVEELQSTVFEPGIIPDRFIEKGRQVFEIYSQINSIELWTTNTLSSTLRQIEYYSNSGYIRSAAVKAEIYDDLKHIIDRVNLMAERGTKILDRVPEESEKNNYKLYESDIELTGNGALGVIGDYKVSFIGHLTFHTLNSDHPVLNEKTLLWYERLVRKANLISTVSAKNRFQFFSLMASQIEASRQRVLP
jgi:hypothetical protein